MTDATTNPRLFSRDPAERRAFLSEVGEGIAYFIPPELRSRFQFLAEMTPSATVERAGSAARSAVQPGLTAGERIGNVGAMLSETAGVVAPFAVAPRAAMPAAEAAQEAFLGFSVPARAAAETAFERLNQPGPMPEVLYSNPPFDHAAFIRQHFGPERKAAADAQRLREDLDANDQLRAERGLPPLNPPPRPADPVPEQGTFQSSAAQNLEVSRRDASNIFGEGAERVRYTDPQSGGTIEVVARPDGTASVLELEVPEQFRGQGIGQNLQERVMQDFPMMGGQVSSKAAATTAYRLGRRPVGKPNATLEDVFAEIDDMSSVNMVSPEMQRSLGAAAPEGAVVKPKMGEAFDDWIDRIYAPENRGPGNQVQDPNVVFRAMSPEEAFFGETEGVFRDVSGAPLYVANDPERYVGGGAYGGRNRGRIYEFDVTDIPGETRAGGVGITERAVSEIPAERVRRIWEWDSDRRSHVLIEDRTGAPRPENFAQGGAVMMRSGMPEQIHQGLGSLSEVARRMFMGGEVSGHPLDQYGQYLTQTYAAPIQQSASQAVSQFVDSVRQKERDYFGGGGMGAPLQGGLMGSPTDAGSTLAVGGLSAPAYSGPEIGRKRAVEPPSLGLGVPQMPMQPGVMAASPFGNNVNPHSPGMSRGDFFAPPSTDSALGRLSATNATAAFAGRGPIPNIAAPMDPRANYVTADALRSGSVFAPEHRRLV
jgi:predicted GNAT family acetyltransferase